MVVSALVISWAASGAWHFGETLFGPKSYSQMWIMWVVGVLAAFWAVIGFPWRNERWSGKIPKGRTALRKEDQQL
jgi:hypothetical protein